MATGRRRRSVGEWLAAVAALCLGFAVQPAYAGLSMSQEEAVADAIRWCAPEIRKQFNIRVTPHRSPYRNGGMIRRTYEQARTELAHEIVFSLISVNPKYVNPNQDRDLTEIEYFKENRKLFASNPEIAVDMNICLYSRWHMLKGNAPPAVRSSEVNAPPKSPPRRKPAKR
jgi:hypothetical protein